MTAASPAYPRVNTALCTGCGLCRDACPCGAIKLVHGLPAFSCGEACATNKNCPAVLHCLQPCEEACPVGAIECPFELCIKDSDAQAE